MKKAQSEKTYTIGLTSGCVVNGEDHKRGEVFTDLSINDAAVIQSCNRGELLGDSDDAKKTAERVDRFKSMIADENKAYKKAG